MRKLLSLLVLGASVLYAQDEAGPLKSKATAITDPTLELKLTIAQQDLQIAQLRAQLDELQRQLQLYEGATGVTQSRQQARDKITEREQALRKAEDALPKPEKPEIAKPVK